MVNGDIEIVQKSGKSSTMSCSLPNSSWSECRFLHFDGSRGMCSLDSSQDHKDCVNFQDSYLHLTEEEDGSKCQLVIESVSDDHVGTWGCEIYEDGVWYQMHSNFSLMLIREPTHIDFYPQTEIYKYTVDQWFEGSLDVQNVAPKPSVEWLMNNSSIEGLTIRDVNVTHNYMDMGVIERLQIRMKSSFNNKYLEFTMRLAAVDEFGKRHPEDDFVKSGKIKFLCSNCFTTQTPTTTTSTLAPIPTTTFRSATLAKMENCSFHMTDLSGDLSWPVPGKHCVSDPSPRWIITIACSGVCVTTINVKFSKLIQNNTDYNPCETSLRIISTRDDSFNRTMCFDENMPVTSSVKTSELQIELLNFTNENPVQVEGSYYFSA